VVIYRQRGAEEAVTAIAFRVPILRVGEHGESWGVGASFAPATPPAKPRN
jgi:hypothetical protein